MITCPFTIIDWFSKSTSTKTGIAPKYSPTSTDATNVNVGTMNLLPFWIFCEAKAKCNAAVHEFKATTCLASNIIFNKLYSPLFI